MGEGKGDVMSKAPKPGKVTLSRGDILAFYKDVDNVFARVDSLLEDNYVKRISCSPYTVRCLCELFINASVLEEYLNKVFPDLSHERYQVDADFVLKLTKVAMLLHEVKTDLKLSNISLDVH